MTKQQFIDIGMVHLEMTEELKQYCIELAKTYSNFNKEMIINDPDRFYCCYELKCKETGYSYYHVLDRTIGTLSQEDKKELELEVKTLDRLGALRQRIVRNATIGNPNQYIKLCYPVYEDIVIYGLNSFDIRIVQRNHYTSSLWTCGTVMLGHSDAMGVIYDNHTVPYNLIEDWYFSGIKCIET